MPANRGFRFLLPGGAAVLTALLGMSMASQANANPSISVAVSESPGLGTNLQVLGSSTSGLYNPAFTTAHFAGSIDAIGSPILTQPTFDTNTIDVNSTSNSGGTLYIYITEQGLSQPSGISNFLSSFTANTFQGDVTSVTESTFVGTSNQLWTGTLLATYTFTGTGAPPAMTVLTPNLGPLFSETAEYVVTFFGTGSSDNTIIMSDPPAAVPEPMSLVLLGSGMFCLGIIRRAGQRAV